MIAFDLIREIILHAADPIIIIFVVKCMHPQVYQFVWNEPNEYRLA